MQCQYCKYFQTGEVVVQTALNGKKEAVRLCLLIRKTVGIDSEACDSFRAAKRFWDERHEMWIEPEICKLNRETRRSSCVSCHQGKIVAEL